MPAVRMTQAGVHAKYHPKRKYIDRYLTFKEAVGYAAKAAVPGIQPVDEPVSVLIEFYSTSRGRADIDNIAKSVLDGMNKVVYRDDVLVHKLTIEWVPVDSDLYERVEVTVRRRS